VYLYWSTLAVLAWMFTQDWTDATKILYAKYKLTWRIPVSCEGSNVNLLKICFVVNLATVNQRSIYQIMNSPRGLSLHIGVNMVDPQHYNNWDGALPACENDADTMRDIASLQGFETRQIKSTEATRKAVRDAILDAAKELSNGDFYLLTYSGHGGQVKDVDDEEADGVDDTWCLYDGQLLDDELNVLLAEFDEGVRVLVVTDSCHSGTMLRGMEPDVENENLIDDGFTISRQMPGQVAVATFRNNKTRYTDIQNALPKPRPEIKASVRLLSGCEEHEESFSSKLAGRFTTAIVNVFNNGAFEGDYEKFHADIKEAVAKRRNPQTPAHMVIGVPSADFDAETPFKIK